MQNTGSANPRRDYHSHNLQTQTRTDPTSPKQGVSLIPGTAAALNPQSKRPQWLHPPRICPARPVSPQEHLQNPIVFARFCIENGRPAYTPAHLPATNRRQYALPRTRFSPSHTARTGIGGRGRETIRPAPAERYSPHPHCTTTASATQNLRKSA